MADHVIEYINIKNVTYQISDPAAEHASGRTTAFPANDSQLSDTKYPSEKLVKTELNKKENVANKIITFDQQVTDTQYPSAKLVKDTIDNIDLTPYEEKANKVSAFQTTPDDTHYPTEKLVKDSLDQIRASAEGGINSTRTYIVDSLPSAGLALNDANYIVRSGDGGLLYRLDNGEWRLVGGSKVLIQDTLPASGDSFTDYYVPTDDTKQIYLHYRWSDPADGEATGHFFAVGTDSYSKTEDNALLAEKEDLSNKITSIVATSTDVQYPSAKAVYSSLQSLKTTLEGKVTNSTQVVSSVPAVATADENVNYVVKESGGALLYRKIDGEMVMVGGAMVSVVDELPTDGEDNPDGNVFTDYYVKTGSGNNAVYYHYRWMDSYTENGQTVEGHFYLVGVDAYSKDQVDGLFDTRLTPFTSRLESVETSTTELLNKASATDQAIANIRNSEKSYRIDLVTDSDTGRNTVTMSQYIGDSEVGEVVSSFPLPEGTGGGGGATAASIMTLEKLTQSPVNLVPTDLEDKVYLEVNFSSVDRETTTETYDGNYILKREGQTVARGVFGQGVNRIEISQYCATGRQQFSLTVSDVAGSTAFKTWTVIVSDIRLEVTYNEAVMNEIGTSVPFRYTPWGEGEKTVHFKLDGRVVAEISSTDSGIGQTYVIPPQPHGAHLLECWITAVVNGNTVEPAHVYKDIIWFDSSSSVPVIGCPYRSDYYGKIQTKQYNTVRIPYVVYDPATNFPTVTISVDGAEVSTENLTSASNVWTYKTSEIRDYHTVRITCKGATVTVWVNVEALDYDIAPVTSGIAFDFNPSGLTNNSEDRLWVEESNSEIALSVSENFDWENGGYQIDEDGNSYFCVKSGTRAYISYDLFGRDPKQNGAEFKLIFKAENVSDRDPDILSCYSRSAGHDVGIQMKAHGATLCTSVSTENAVDPEVSYASILFVPYSEEDIIEFDYSIYPLGQNDPDSYIMAYEDGVATRAILYTNNANLFQTVPVPITIGSDGCDVRVYRMKAYERSLSDIEILTNYEADARDAETIVNRFERNQVHSQGTEITPESVANACPDLKVIKIDAPYFTKSKKDYVKNTTVTCIHRNGRKEDNWTWENGYHVGQGTTSDNYGKAGRNIDLIFGFDGENQVVSKIPLDREYVSVLRIEDGPEYLDGSGKITLTDSSVPNNWFNIKVNIASSENANNALFQKRYNDFLPYKTPARKRDSRIKNGMEFVNCVVFIRENDSNVETHREFRDTNWHFYALGNIGDSKKTDSTRVNDPTDIAEFVVEIHDNIDANSDFASGVYYDTNGNKTFEYVEGYSYKYPITSAEWNDPRNTKRAALYDDWDGSFEFRYDMGTKDGNTIETPDILAAQETAKQIWRDMYEFVVTADNERFVNELGNWFIVDSPLYWYLFTERYIMIDNRAKNSFWHWGRTYISTATAATWQAAYNEDPETYKYKNPADYIIDDAAASINNGYRFDLWIYDTDTAIGIDNNGFLRLDYGTEDIDHIDRDDPSTMFQYNGARSIFWCRIRDLMNPQLRSLYQTLESGGCWNATTLIKEWEDWQNMFPEELWRKDIERKYMRPYFSREEVEAGKVPVNRYIKFMLNGRKRYQRRQFERYQEVYISTKYFGTAHCSATDAVDLRCRPYSSSVVPQNYAITIVPFIDMYLAVQYGTESNLSTGRRVRAGVPETFTTTVSSFQDTQILIFCPDYIQEISDLSACYMGMNNFANAVRLKSLTVGNATPGYTSPYLTTLGLGRNKFLEYLDLRNCNKLSSDLDLSGCPNLKTLYAEGTAIQAINFANGGKIQTAHLPESINGLTMRNLKYLTDLTFERANESDPYYKNLASITSEYCAMDPYPIIYEAINVLQIIRVLGIDWTFSDTDMLNRIYTKYSSMLSGKATITEIYRVSDVANFNSKWPDLELDVEQAQPVQQFNVTYVNWDGTPLHNNPIKVDMGNYPPNPIEAGIIDTAPTRPADSQYEYTFSGWDGLNVHVYADMVVRATYTENTRTYTVKWYLKEGNMTPLLTRQVPYGSEAIYDGDTPTDYSVEDTLMSFRAFNGWDKSTGYVEGDLNVYAKWEDAYFPEPGKKLWNMSPAEIYAVSRKREGDRFTNADWVDIKMGNDFDFRDPDPYPNGDYHLGYVKEQVLAQDMYFDGTTQLPTNVQLFAPDAPSFTLMIDYEFDINNATGATLVHCRDRVSGDGFSLTYYKSADDSTSNYNQIAWSSQATARVGKACQRNVVVLRHVHGSDTLSIHSFNGSSTSSTWGVYDMQVSAFSRSSGGAIPETDAFLTLGATRVDQNGQTTYQSRFRGWIYRAKVWFADLGISVAKELAAWPGETIRARFAGQDRQFLVNNVDETAHLAFYVGNLLPMAIQYSEDGSLYQRNTWEGSKMQKFFRERIVPGLPRVWRSIIKPVRVVTSDGANRGTWTSSSEMVYPPSYGEVTSLSNSSSEYRQINPESNGYIRELFGDTIGNFRWPGIIAEDRGIADGTRYFTTSYDPADNQGITPADGDIWYTSGSPYYRHIFISTETASKHSQLGAFLKSSASYNTGSNVQIAYQGCGYWVRCSNYWLRSPSVSSTNYFYYYYASYSYSSYWSTSYYNNAYYILFGFSV